MMGGVISSGWSHWRWVELAVVIPVIAWSEDPWLVSCTEMEVKRKGRRRYNQRQVYHDVVKRELKEKAYSTTFLLLKQHVVFNLIWMYSLKGSI